RALAQREQPARQRRLAIDADERFCPDQLACGTEQRMAMVDGPHIDASNAVEHAAKDRGVDMLNSATVGAEALTAHNQRYGNGVDAEDQRPFLGDNMKQCFNAIGVDGGKDSLMNRSDGARMTSR